MVNMLLFLAEQCKRYYAASEIPAMLETFLPLLTQDVRAYIRIHVQISLY
jgi:proteasome activator subunit 4